MISCYLGRPNVTEAILEIEGVDPNLSNLHGYAALHDACMSGSVECAKLLLQAGAHLDQRNKMMFTPLDIAVDRENQEVGEYLRSLGAFCNAMEGYRFNWNTFGFDYGDIGADYWTESDGPHEAAN